MKRRRIMKEMRLEEISAVDRPAQEGARVALMKRHETFEKLKPHAGESKQDFISRFMSDEGMKKEYPEQDQRLAVAHSMWERKDMKKATTFPSEGPLAEALQKGTDTGDIPEDIQMTPEEKAAFEKAAQEKLDALQKRAERAEKLAELTDAQKDHLASLGAEDQDRFLALSKKDRETAIARLTEANPVVETIDGVDFRKNDDPRLLAMAKQLKAERDSRAKAEAKVYEEQLAKRADELAHLPGEPKVRVALLKAVDKLESSDRDSVMALLKAHDKNLTAAFETHGVSGTPEADSPEAKISAIAKAIREKEPKLTAEQAYSKALETPEGRELYAKR